MLSITIIGAAGYVGIELVKRLYKKKYHCIGVTNSNGFFLLKNYHIQLIKPGEYKKLAKSDIIINLAYPNKVPPLQHKSENENIFQILKHIVSENTKIIQISSQAVFGYQFEHEIVPGPVKNRHDHAYITSKIYLENRITDYFRNNEIHIIRLGNVWGPGAPAWTFGLLNKLVFGDPVGIIAKDGYSNTTDVRNIASYIEFIIENIPKQGSFYHHLSEFSHLRWSFWIDNFCKLLQLDPVYIDALLDQKTSFQKEMLSSIKGTSPVIIARHLMRGQYTGSWMRSLLAKLPYSFLSRLEQKTMSADYFPTIQNFTPRDTFMSIMSCEKQFKNHLIKGWVPEITPEESWEKIKEWMKSVGYSY